jgi:hypothetical protein
MAHFGDTRDRKRTFSVLLMAVPTLLIGLLPTYQSIGLAAAIRDQSIVACKAGRSSTLEFLRRFDRRSESVGSTIEYASIRWTLPQSSFRSSLLCTSLQLPRSRTPVAVHTGRSTYPQLSRCCRICTPR